jgi:hypothetical protein
VLPVPGWSTSNNFTVAIYGTASGVPSDVPGPPDRRNNFFVGGPNTALSVASQLIDVSGRAGQIDLGAITMKLTGYLGGYYDQNDNAVLSATFLGAAGNSLGQAFIGPVVTTSRAGATGLLFRGCTNSVPSGTKRIEVVLTMTRTWGDYNDGLADSLSLVLVAGPFFEPLPVLPAASLGRDYTQTLRAAGGVLPVMHSISNGALPPGLALSNDGVLSGVPTATGIFTFVVRATDAIGMFAEQPCSLRVFAPVATPSGLVAWWRAENNPLDSAGLNHGTMINGATYADGKVGRAFSLDGVDDRVAIPERPATDLSRLPGWTIEAWVRPTSFGESPTINFPTIYSEGRWTASLGLNHGTGRLETWINNQSSFLSTIALQLGAWSHIASTYAGSTLTFYVNGVAAGSFTTPAILPDNDGAAIGDVPLVSDSSTFQGQVDELSLYNRALTAAEIASIYNADLAGKQPAGPYFNALPPLPDAILGRAYAQTIRAAGGAAPVIHSISNGALPPGMTLGNDGVFNGIPAATGVFSFVVRATDAIGLFAEQPCSILVCAPVVAPSGLVAWWRGENNPLDSAGTNHGTMINGATYADGKVGRAFSLDGVDDMVSIPEAPAIDLSRLPAWTIEAWVRPTSFWQTTWISFPTIYSEGLWAVSLGFNHGTGRLETWINFDFQLLSTSSVQLGAWSHVASTYAGSTLTFYVNGVAADSFTTPAISPDDDGASIGNVPLPAYSSAFEGQIDELSLYNRALTVAEIASIYNAGIAGKQLATGVAPTLSIQLTTSNTVIISWPSPSTGFTLQQNTNGVTTSGWSNVLVTPVDNGTTKSIIVNPSAGNRFYRLVSQ